MTPENVDNNRTVAWVGLIQQEGSVPYISVHPDRLSALAFVDEAWVKMAGTSVQWTREPLSEDDCGALSWALGPLDQIHPLKGLSNDLRAARGSK